MLVDTQNWLNWGPIKSSQVSWCCKAASHCGYEKENSLKIDHFVPGTKIPIKSEKELFEKKEKHKYLLNLAWHIPDEINTYMKEKNFEGKIVNILE